MSNFPVNPDLATFSDVIYSEAAVLAAFGKNFTLDQLQPVDNKSNQRSFTYAGDPSSPWPIGRWNNEIVYNLQAGEYSLAWSNFQAYYIGVLIPLGYPLIVLNSVEWKLNIIEATAEVYPIITFNFLPFEPIP